MFYQWIFKVFNDLPRSQNRSSLGTRYFWPWEADESKKDEENRVERERLIEFFTTAQNNFLSGPQRKWVAVWLRSILPTVLYGLQLYLGSNLVIRLICIAAPSSRHYSQLRSTGTSVFHTGGYPRNLLVRVILIGWLGCCVSHDWLAKAGTSMFSCVTHTYFSSSSDWLTGLSTSAVTGQGRRTLVPVFARFAAATCTMYQVQIGSWDYHSLASKGRHQHVFLRHPHLFFFKLWLAHWTVYLCCDWPGKVNSSTCFRAFCRGCMHDVSSPDWIVGSFSSVIGQWASMLQIKIQ